MYTHGSLENEILNAVWSIEENEAEASTISVNEVQDSINQTGNIRAYTTVKTVMDRLVDKKILNRQKKGKKFFYNSAFSRKEMAKTAIRHIAGQYFNNDIRSFMNALEKEYQGIRK
ncbi:BlaI/MecI/CopY family transcriptional regulator [bacterium]|nr:BlaI/MecI/CopY family transcriptional regulator [bacterium]